MSGIFISQGMTIGIPAGGLILSVDDNGEVKSELKLHVNFDVCPTWLQVAVNHLIVAKENSVKRAEAWSSNNENQKAESLEKEFESSMQAIMASAIAFDSFYAKIKEKVIIPEQIISAWKNNGTARYKQIAEVIRIGFCLKNDGANALRENLKEIFKYRDLAVHPSGKISEPILHPELNVGVEWRFAYFRFSNAHLVVKHTLRMFSELANSPPKSNIEISKYVEGFKTRITPICHNWPSDMGNIFDTET